MTFGEENSCSLSTICSCQKSPAAIEVRSPELMNDPVIMASTLLDGASDHSSVSLDQKELNNNNVDDENLAEVFGKCMESALSHCLGGSQKVSQPVRTIF